MCGCDDVARFRFLGRLSTDRTANNLTECNILKDDRSQGLRPGKKSLLAVRSLRLLQRTQRQMGGLIQWLKGSVGCSGRWSGVSETLLMVSVWFFFLFLFFLSPAKS